MRLLALVGEPPWPAHSGYRIRCWELLSRLAERFPTRLICLDERSDPPGDSGSPDRPGWESRFDAVRRVRRRRTGPLSLARSLVSSEPHHAWLHDGDELRRVLAEEAARCDVVVSHYLYFARALASLAPATSVKRPLLVLDQHNLDRDTWESHAGAAKGPLRWWLAAQAARVRRDEATYLPLFDAIFSVSERDAQRTREIAGETVRVEVAPNAADCARLHPVPREREGRTVLFTGTRARRNVDGLAWFIRHCWPLVCQQVPDARLLVAGRIDANDLPGRLGHEAGITFTGAQEDLRNAFADADVAIVPIRLGGGTKLKVFEALASGVPVVALSASTSGCCCGERDGLLVHDEPLAYAMAVSRLLRDGSRRLRLGEAARLHAEQAHDWVHVATRAGDVIDELNSRDRDGSRPRSGWDETPHPGRDGSAHSAGSGRP